ncbi:MAG TPA: hypothetical protein VL172_21035, partial [Kofleriaceae bacterium]|nr:hypothetical protein [Kofleriaceae bacterium]
MRISGVALLASLSLIGCGGGHGGADAGGDGDGDGDGGVAVPMVDITSPTEGQVGGPGGLTLTFTLGTGATLAGCTIDDVPVDGCQSGMTLAPAGGAHVVEVTATNTDGDTASDTAGFTIDAQAPLVEAIAVTTATDGTAA